MGPPQKAAAPWASHLCWAPCVPSPGPGVDREPPGLSGPPHRRCLPQEQFLIKGLSVRPAWSSGTLPGPHRTSACALVTVLPVCFSVLHLFLVKDRAPPECPCPAMPLWACRRGGKSLVEQACSPASCRPACLAPAGCQRRGCSVTPRALCRWAVKLPIASQRAAVRGSCWGPSAFPPQPLALGSSSCVLHSHHSSRLDAEVPAGVHTGRLRRGIRGPPSSVEGVPFSVAVPPWRHTLGPRLGSG